MAQQYGFWFELDKCVECHACEVACKAENDVELGVNWRRVTNVWSGSFPDVTFQTVSMSCMHCANPACEAACPVGAISKDPETGAVTVDSDECLGCHYCFFACPFGVPQYGEDGTMQKCEMCLDRIEQGLEAKCATTCPSGALHFGTMDELAKLAQAKVATVLAASTQPSMVVSK